VPSWRRVLVKVVRRSRAPLPPQALIDRRALVACLCTKPRAGARSREAAGTAVSSAHRRAHRTSTELFSARDASCCRRAGLSSPPGGHRARTRPPLLFDPSAGRSKLSTATILAPNTQPPQLLVRQVKLDLTSGGGRPLAHRRRPSAATSPTWRRSRRGGRGPVTGAPTCSRSAWSSARCSPGECLPAQQLTLARRAAASGILPVSTVRIWPA